MIKFQGAESQKVKGFPLSEGSPEVSGNWGLLDQVAALTWVQAHIGVFGGNPRRVALAADRGGADVASIHLLTTGAAGSRLFRRIVLMVSYPSCLPPRSRCWPGKVLSGLLRPAGFYGLVSPILCSEHVSYSWPSGVCQGAGGSPDGCPLLSEVPMIPDGGVFRVLGAPC